ncbi:MAG: PEP-CTERM sorting domain-containing protein [Planctomycetota bacterium]
MALSPLHSVHSFSLVAALAFGPFGGCDGSSDQPVDPGGTVSEEPTAPTATPPVVETPALPPRTSTPTPPPGGGTLPHGGTPEPATMLLLGGSAAGYVALRRRKRDSDVQTEQD